MKTLYYVRVFHTEKENFNSAHYGERSGPFHERSLAEQAAANALGLQTVTRVEIESDELATDAK